jgi:nucleotide-binding universal stress UspA family protein
VSPSNAGSSDAAVIMLCVDGSDLSTNAVAAGLELVRSSGRPLVVTVVEASDESLVTGGGHFGGVMSAEELSERDTELEAEGRAVAEHAAAALGIDGAEIRVVRGDPGPALCALAAEVSARALVVGSRGRGGIKRALLGSVSDYLVRNAPCPVVITGPTT